MNKLLLLPLLATSVVATPIPHLLFEDGNVGTLPLIITFIVLSTVIFYIITLINNGSLIKESNLVIDASLSLALSVILVFLFPFIEILQYYMTLSLFSLIFWALILIFTLGSVLGIYKNLNRADTDWLKDEQVLYDGLDSLKKEEAQLNRYLMVRVNHLSPEQKEIFAIESKIPKIIAKVFEKRINQARKLSTPGVVSLGKIIRTAQLITAMIPTKEDLLPYLLSHEGKQFLHSMADEIRELKRHVTEVKFLENTHLNHLIKKVGVVVEKSSIPEKTELHFLATKVNEKYKIIHDQMRILLNDLEKQILNKKINIKSDFLSLGETLTEMNLSVKELEAELRLIRREHLFYIIKHPLITLKHKFKKKSSQNKKSLNTKRRID